MKLINTKDYLLLIDEEAEIKENDKVLDEQLLIGEIISITKLYGYRTKLCEGGEAHYFPHREGEEKIVKILAYYPLTKEAKELDLPLLPDPFKEEFDAHTFIQNEFGFTDEEMDKWRIFLNGSNLADYQNILNLVEKAAQLKQFSLEDIRKIVNLCLSGSFSSNEECFNKVIQSLSTEKLPLEFIPEYPKELKTIIVNGKTTLKGVYKYE